MRQFSGPTHVSDEVWPVSSSRDRTEPIALQFIYILRDRFADVTADIECTPVVHDTQDPRIVIIRAHLRNAAIPAARLTGSFQWLLPSERLLLRIITQDRAWPCKEGTVGSDPAPNHPPCTIRSGMTTTSAFPVSEQSSSV
jgi:hypothetical protein